jgi:zinc and cadmium transporter
MTEIRLAAVYCLFIVLASLAGGWLPRWLRLTHGLMQVLLSFVAGVLLGIGILHLLPHGFYEWTEVDPEHAMDRSVGWLLIGFLGMFFLQRLFHFHTHEAPDELIETSPAGKALSDEHDHAHAPHAHAHNESAFHNGHRAFTWGGVFFGLTVHSLIDGMTLAAVIAAEWDHGGAVLWAGFGYFLAILLHKPFDSLSIASLMIAARVSRGWRNVINCAYALVAPIGVAIFYLGLQKAGEAAPAILGGALCFAAGACLCISSSDLLPELQFHSHDRLKLSSALVAGLALAWGLVYLESQSHDHHHHHSHGERSAQIDHALW